MTKSKLLELLRQDAEKKADSVYRPEFNEAYRYEYRAMKAGHESTHEIICDLVEHIEAMAACKDAPGKAEAYFGTLAFVTLQKLFAKLGDGE